MKLRERAMKETIRQSKGPELQNIYDKEKAQKEVDVELMNIENLISVIQDWGLNNDKIRLIKEAVIEQIKTCETPNNLQNFERKSKSKQSVANKTIIL